MFKPLSQLNYFFRLATERKLCGSDQLLYLHIFNKFNMAHGTETLRIKDAELKEAMRLHDSNGNPISAETIRRGKQRLKGKGFIDFESGKGGELTEYRLIQLYPDGTPDDTPESTLENSYIRVREDVLEVNNNSICQSARTRDFEELDDIVEFWEKQLLGGRLSIEHQSELLFHLKEKGYSWVKECMKESSEANMNPRGLQPKFFFAVLRKKLDGEKNKVPKGNVKNSNVEEKKTYGQPSGLQKPVRSGNEPWASRKRES